MKPRVDIVRLVFGRTEGLELPSGMGTYVGEHGGTSRQGLWFSVRDWRDRPRLRVRVQILEVGGFYPFGAQIVLGDLPWATANGRGVTIEVDASEGDHCLAGSVILYGAPQLVGLAEVLVTFTYEDNASPDHR